MTHQQLYDKIKQTSKDAYTFSETVHLNHASNNRKKMPKATLKKILALPTEK